jgi:hypothetical protein
MPRVVIMSIVDFPLFDCEAYHSEFRPFEVKRGELLSDRMVLHYFEVRKLPKDIDRKDELQLLLSLFRARTDEELKQLDEMGVQIVKQAIGEYRKIVVSPEFRELERLRREALSNEAAALRHARQMEAQKWQSVVADKDAALAEQEALIKELQRKLQNNVQ